MRLNFIGSHLTSNNALQLLPPENKAEDFKLYLNKIVHYFQSIIGVWNSVFNRTYAYYELAGIYLNNYIDIQKSR